MEEWTTLSLASYVSLFVSFHVSEYTLRSKTLKGSAKAFSVEHDWSPRKSTRALLPALATRPPIRRFLLAKLRFLAALAH